MVDFSDLRKKASKAKQFSEVVDNQELFPDTELLSDHENEPLILLGVDFRTSKTYGEFATITAMPLDEDIVLKLRSTSAFILTQLHKLSDEGNFPVEATCVKQGKAWMLK